MKNMKYVGKREIALLCKANYKPVTRLKYTSIFCSCSTHHALEDAVWKQSDKRRSEGNSLPKAWLNSLKLYASDIISLATKNGYYLPRRAANRHHYNYPTSIARSRLNTGSVVVIEAGFAHRRPSKSPGPLGRKHSGYAHHESFKWREKWMKKKIPQVAIK